MFALWPQLLLLIAPLTYLAHAQTHIFNFNVTYVENANPDGLHPRRVIGFNNQWPLPNIHVKRNDRVLLYLHNQLPDQNTTLHFHGLLQNGSNVMDGPQFVTQCPIPPGETLLYNFTVTDQVGTYWYHSHTSNQYSDGLRGAFIIHDLEPLPFQYDDEMVLTVSDWYHDEGPVLISKFLNRYNPTGAEPIPNSLLFNDSSAGVVNVETDTTYLIRIANMGMFVAQYLYIEDHDFEIVEIDGILVEPQLVESLHISVGQRVSILLHTKKSAHKNYCFMQLIDEEMLDFKPPELELYYTNHISYDKSYPQLETYIKTPKELNVYDDFNLRPLGDLELLDEYDYQITVDFAMENLGNGVNYAFFNNISYTPPKIPALYTVLSSPPDLVMHSQIYGSNTNSFILQKNEVIEIVVNNKDPGKHPFHLHGHNFQVISRSGEGDDDEPIVYNETDPLHTQFPQYPAVRDTVLVEANGFVVLRFQANNPGVWFFHCHVDWHLEQGLALVLIENPVELQKQIVPENHLRVCNSAKVGTKGNAAGNFKDWLDLQGENLQYDPLPEGFTLKGYVALIISTILGLTGVYTIFVYGLEDVKPDDEQVIRKLYSILKDHNALDPDSNGDLNGDLQDDINLQSNLENVEEQDVDERTLLSSA